MKNDDSRDMTLDDDTYLAIEDELTKISATMGYPVVEKPGIGGVMAKFFHDDVTEHFHELLKANPEYMKAFRI